MLRSLFTIIRDMLRALVARLEKHIAEIRSDDLVSPDEIAFPTERTILRLEQRSAGAAIARQKKLEELYVQAEEANEEIRSQRDASYIPAPWRNCWACGRPQKVVARARRLLRVFGASDGFPAALEMRMFCKKLRREILAR
jgi:hypothetical protein